MAKKSMIARESKRAQAAARFAAKRERLKAVINDRSAEPEAVDAAVVALQKLP
jgi:small subunit ribosomal protein S14